MTEVIEKVARAICVAEDYRPICSMCRPNSEMPNNGCRGVRYKRAAKAAIEAVRSPTPEMLEAANGTHALCDPGPYPSFPGDDEIWQAMIDVVLEGKL